jgi:hypothetical protein
LIYLGDFKRSDFGDMHCIVNKKIVMRLEEVIKIVKKDEGIIKETFQITVKKIEQFLQRLSFKLGM